jgi:hypothetical protein
MRLLDVGQEAHGFIAVGQLATGFIAFGQMATGVIAVGQLARGFVVVGQVGFGLFAAGGMGVATLGYGAGMAGVAGRNVFGLILPLVPSVGKPRVVPQTVTLAAAQAARVGWVDVTITKDASGAPEVRERATSAEVALKIDHRAAGGALALAGRTERVLARVEPADAKADGAPLVITRFMRVPDPPYKRKGFALLAAVQLVAYVILAIVWWFVVGVPVFEALAHV